MRKLGTAEKIFIKLKKKMKIINQNNEISQKNNQRKINFTIEKKFILKNSEILTSSEKIFAEKIL